MEARGTNSADADRITSPVAPSATRPAHDISLRMYLDAGLPITDIQSDQHAVDSQAVMNDPSQVTLQLADRKELPNRDFVLRWRTTAERIEDAILTHTDKRGKFFTLVLQPPARTNAEAVLPKEIMFVIDKSGSMRGFPLETVKKAMRKSIASLHEDDTFNLMTFEGGVGFCFDTPVANTEANRRTAFAYLDGLQGSGGTEMMRAICACLDRPANGERLRVVCFMTDGFVGNDMAIIDAVRQHADAARVFPMGIGTSVNRFLIEGIARAGHGEAEIVLSPEQADEAVSRFYERIRNPILANIELEIDGVEVEEIYPRAIPDLFDAQPIVISGRYSSGGAGKLTLTGNSAAGKFTRTIELDLPDESSGDDAMAAQWARAKVDHLLTSHWGDVQHDQLPEEIRQQIVDLGVEYRLLTQYTSFVAVEHKVRSGGAARTQVHVPVELPARVSHEGIFGAQAISVGSVASDDMLCSIGCYSGSALEGRGSAGRRRQLVKASGGSDSSETAVAQSLRWMASRQSADGGWSFDHNNNLASPGPDCPNPGALDARNGATALALLPFLGAGQTHKEGAHKKAVYAGLAYLIKNMRVREKAGNWEDNGRLHSHAWATLAMCEAYAMTHDKELLAPAQLAINHLAARQAPQTGGWPSSDGKQDTVLAAWCLLALKSGHMAYLNVPNVSITRAKKFLDARGEADGAVYRRYKGEAPHRLATAAGLLCQMYLGREQGDPALVRGVSAISKAGPSDDDVRWNFLATNVMIQFQDENWRRWNLTVRDSLVKSQSREGPAAGSWFFEGAPGAHTGGRLYHTALAAMTLEVYYRHLPIYRPPPQ